MCIICVLEASICVCAPFRRPYTSLFGISHLIFLNPVAIELNCMRVVIYKHFTE